MKYIAWVTRPSFIDTDIYVLKHLIAQYRMDIYVIRRKGEHTDYTEQLYELNHHANGSVMFVDIPDNNKSPKTFLFYRRFQKNLRKYDLVYQPSGFPWWTLVMMLYGRRKRLVVPVHNVHTPKGGSNYWTTFISTRFTCLYFKNFITFSESQRNLLLQFKGRRNVLYAPFMLKDYGVSKKTRTDKRVTFLNFGNIRDYKRVDVLILAAQRAYEELMCPFRVIIAGSCSDWEKYQRLIRFPELFDLLIRRVDSEEIPDLFVESDYFVCPYQDIAQSGSVIVAINYRKPIIASKLPAFEEYIENGYNGYLLPSADEASLAECIKNVVRNHQNNYALLVANLNTMISERFDDRVIIDKYINFFESL